ncbi:hypothetical protein [Staphylothermus hellenicus]|uniref:Uncharacterized protein n=1 Tax=Staphylothermus hellenicus (strain DSM 12710 / JCM 10830 / BK20S6-10-b1 / P8) TaxID=591019 RepID=D7D9Y7_STAHD|nr:hypothetical protein [Staphylothermus hellenicus]ADI32583.1 hypothetical protein Shell_1495 [Staphylothermus hellenicus DSM 12710]
MPETDAYSVKKLSPSEPMVTIRLFIEVPRQIPLTKIEKTLSRKYGYKTMITSPYSLEARISMPIRLLSELLDKVESTIRDLSVKASSICIDYYVVLKTDKCLCNIYDDKKIIKREVLGSKIFCLVEISDDIVAFIYCRLDKKRYQTIRFLEKEKFTSSDLLQLPKTLFIRCKWEDHAKEVKRIRYNIETFINNILLETM